MRVLIPLDGSPLSEIAFEVLDPLTSMAPLSVRLVSVVASVEGLTEVARDETHVRESNLLHAYVGHAVERLSSKAGVSGVEGHVVSGDPVTMIIDQVSEFQPDVLVLASHGRTGFSRWRMSSVADAILRSGIANCLVVGPKSRMHPVVRSVLVPLDGSSRSERAVQEAVGFAKGLAATLHLVRVVDSPVGVAEGDQGSFEDLKGHWSEYLESFQEEVGGNLDIRTAVRFGGPFDRLREYAAVNEIGLVVMASRGSGGVSRTAFGSVASGMIRGPVPVLLVKSEAS